MKRVIVVGGGISGLAAALYLKRAQRQLRVDLIEASDRLGGVLDTVYDGPYLIERSADNFATLIPDALELSRECSLEQDLIRPRDKDRRAFVVNRGRLLPIPAGFSLMQPTRVASILATRALSLRGKFRLLQEYWIPARRDSADESLASFATRRLGAEAYQNLVEPIVSGIFTADPDTLSMHATMSQFVKMEREHGGLIRGHLAAKRRDAVAAARKASGARYDQFVAPRRGMADWISKLGQQLPSDSLHLNTSVTALQKLSDGRWSLHTPRRTFLADAVILAVPAARTAGLLSEAMPRIAHVTKSVSYASSVVAALVLNKADLKARTDGFGVIVPRREGRRTLAISYTSNKYPGRVPDDQILLRVFLGGALDPTIIDRSDEELLDLASTEVRELLGWQGSMANWQAVIRWREAMPQYTLGHVDRVREIRSLLSPDHATLKLCGAAYEGVGIPQCVRGGRQAAREILEAMPFEDE